jgi:hypothetical protein
MAVYIRAMNSDLAFTGLVERKIKAQKEPRHREISAVLCQLLTELAKSF